MVPVRQEVCKLHLPPEIYRSLMSTSMWNFGAHCSAYDRKPRRNSSEPGAMAEIRHSQNPDQIFQKEVT